MVGRLHQAVQERNLEGLDEIAAGEFAEIAKRWVSPFQSAFPDFEMELVDLIARATSVRRVLKICSRCNCESIDVCRMFDERVLPLRPDSAAIATRLPAEARLSSA